MPPRPQSNGGSVLRSGEKIEKRQFGFNHRYKSPPDAPHGCLRNFKIINGVAHRIMARKKGLGRELAGRWTPLTGVEIDVKYCCHRNSLKIRASSGLVPYDAAERRRRRATRSLEELVDHGKDVDAGALARDGRRRAPLRSPLRV